MGFTLPFLSELQFVKYTEPAYFPHGAGFTRG